MSDHSPASFDANARRSFLLGLQRTKKKKAKESAKRSAELLRKVRSDRRHARKDEREQVVRDLVEKQMKLGIRSLPLLTDGASTLLLAEVDASNPTDVKIGELDVTDSAAPPTLL